MKTDKKINLILIIQAFQTGALTYLYFTQIKALLDQASATLGTTSSVSNFLNSIFGPPKT